MYLSTNQIFVSQTKRASDSESWSQASEKRGFESLPYLEGIDVFSDVSEMLVWLG